MSEALDARAEVLKLARLLRRDPAALEYLEQVPSADIRALREQVTDMLFTAHGHALSRLTAGSKVLPVGLIAIIGERALGPLLSARIAGMLEPSRAIDVAAKLPTSFLAEVAVDIDPRRASDVIAGIPPQQVAAVTRELVRREEHVTMGRFVGHLSDEAMRAALQALDDRTLLQVGFVLEEKDRLDHIVSLLPERRLNGVTEAAAAANLWPEVLDLLAHLSEPRRAAVASSAAAISLDDAGLASFAWAVIQEETWDLLFEIAERMPEHELSRFAGALAAHLSNLDPADRERLLARGQSAGILERLGPLRVALGSGP
jgi:hypothetical protein